MLSAFASDFQASSDEAPLTASRTRDNSKLLTCLARCSHCKDLEPTWDDLADELQGRVNVAKVPELKQQAAVCCLCGFGFCLILVCQLDRLTALVKRRCCHVSMSMDSQ